MADVKWIKITTDIFDDEKILLIESMPDAYAIITVWFKLLCLAGKQNNAGVFTMNDRIAYTDEMLATVFRMKVPTVKLALETFEAFGMIEMVNGIITIPNWEKHQSLDQLEERRKYMREYMAERRAKQKLLCNANNETLEKVNGKVDSKVNVSTAEEDKNKNKKENKSKYGEYSHVRLTDSELQKLTEEYGETKTLKAIKILDEYIETSGKSYKSHYLVMKKWCYKAVDEQQEKASSKPKNAFCDFDKEKAYDKENADLLEQILNM